MNDDNGEGHRNAGSGAIKGGSRARLRDFSRSLPMSLLKAREAVMHHFRPHLQFYGITEQQWRVLRALTTVESIEVMALADATFLLPPSLSRIVKDLEERRLINRRTSEQDMRRGIISISEEGRRLIKVAGDHSEAIYAEITRRYGAEKLVEVQGMLRELEAALADPIEIEAQPLSPAANEADD
jgi:homoprotocatechuate degradation regulator HpaR